MNDALTGHAPTAAGPLGSVRPEGLPRPSLTGRSPKSSHTLTSVALVVAAVSGVLVAVSAAVSIATVATLLLVAAVVLRPPMAAFVLVGATPLIVGMERGAVLPALRPNEALVLVLAATLLARGAFRWWQGGPAFAWQPRLTPVDVSLLALAVAGSVLPLLSMVARARPVAADDVLYALVLWKYLAVYTIVRVTVRDAADVRLCLWLSMGAAAIVGVVGILQALELSAVPTLLASLYAPDGDPASLAGNRATSTIGHSMGLADFMVFNLAIAAGFLARSRCRSLLVGGAVLFALGSLASGQFSAVVALLVGGGAVGFLCGRLREVAVAAIPFLFVAGVALAPVIEQRLSDIDPRSGLPQSWVVRQENLETYFLPHLTGSNLLLGVRPAARVPAPEALGDWVYIESGHLWLLWTGGIPMLVVFFVVLGAAARRSLGIARTGAGSVGVAGTAAFAATAVIAVVTLFDPHLTLRGTADLWFPLLALCHAGTERATAPETGAVTTRSGVTT